jgi:histidine triad (HIT) family protein
MSDQTYDPNNIFAKILRGEIPATKIYEDDVVMAFMDIMPRCDGHVLVVTKLPVRGLLDMPAAALGPFMSRVQKVARAVQIGMKADGLTLHQFNEPAGGQTVFHLHVHVLPRVMGVSLRPHSGPIEKPEVLQAHAAKIKAALAG